MATFRVTKMILPSYLRTLLMSSILIVICLKGCTLGAYHCVHNLQMLDKLSKPKLPFVLSGQIVVPSYTFACFGVIKKWEARINGHVLSSIHFQVWRMDSTLKIHHLVGENVISTEAADNSGLSYTLQGTNLALTVTDPLQQINVAPGDIIGVFVGNEGNIKIQYRVSMDTVTFTANVPRPLEGFVTPLIDPAFQSRLNAAPLIDVDMEETADVTVTMTFSTPTKTKQPFTTTSVPVPSSTPGTGKNGGELPSVPYELITGVVVSGAILIALCIGLIVVIVCYIKAKIRNRISESPRIQRDNPSQSHSSVLNLLPLLDTPRRKILMAFKRQQTMRDTIENTTRSRAIAEVDLSKTQESASKDIELSYANPVTNTSMLQSRSTSSSSKSKSLPARKPSAHAHIPLPEVPNAFEMKENPSYQTLPTESLDQPDMAEPNAVTRQDLDNDNVYDVPVFTRQSSAPPLEYEIPVSSLTSSGGHLLESIPHVYETTDGAVYAEIFD